MYVDINAPAGRRYSIIYADPPWSYQNGGRGAAKNHYGTMTPERIKALPVEALAAQDAVLFMWATFPQLPQALETIKAWGFTYKTLGFNWIKTNRRASAGGGTSLFWGLGFWTRANPEVCLLAIRGRPRRASARVHSVIVAPVGRHSAKPPETRERIVDLLGDLPRIELFARDTAPGWDCWGDEVEAQE